MTVAQFNDALTDLHSSFAFSETSGWRTPARNAQVGGHPNSKHLVGLGKDVVPDDVGIFPRFRLRAAALGVSVLDEGDHWHLQPSSRGRTNVRRTG